jgi:hypothetical protein
MNILTVTNHGPYVRSTNYWSLPASRAGQFFLSLNAGAFRLLIPHNQTAAIREMRTAKEIVLTYGQYRGVDAIELLFDDRSEDPFSIHLDARQSDRTLPPEDYEREWIFLAYEFRHGGAHKVLDRPCYVRRHPTLPYLRPWKLDQN